MIITSSFPDVAIPDCTLPAFVLEHTAGLGNKAAIIDGDSGRELSYAELHADIRRCATGLAARELRPGDVFAIMMPNLPEYPVAYHAVLTAGGIVTTLSPLASVEEASSQLADSAARFLLTVPPFLDTARAAAANAGVEQVYVMGPPADGAAAFSELLGQGDAPPTVPIDPARDLAALLYSSGTTGRPKGVMLTRGQDPAPRPRGAGTGPGLTAMNSGTGLLSPAAAAQYFRTPARVRDDGPVTGDLPVVGRNAELAVLHDELARARRGELRSVLLTGEPGMGKTRLAKQLLTIPGATALSARAYPLGESSPFGLWAEALERHLRVLPPEEITTLCAGSERDLAAVLRSVAAVAAAVPQGEPPRARLLAALAGLVATVAANRTMVLLLDDLQIADASSLEALHYIAHSCAESPVLVLGTARPAELGEDAAASEVLLRLEQEGMLRRLPVGPLDAPALRSLSEAMIDAPAPDALVGWLEERSRGNVLFAVGLLRALLDEGADLAAPSLRRLPESLVERVGIRLDQLDASALDAVELLAVLGRTTELRVLVAVTELPPDEVAEVLERLVRAGLVTEAEQGLELTFEPAHPLIAEAVYQRIGAARRRVLHRRVGRVLVASGGPGRAAAHFVRSAQPGDDEAVDVLREAVRRAERTGAYEEALSVLAALVDLLPAGDHRWRGVVEDLDFDAQWVVDHRADRDSVLGIEALHAMDRALEHVGDPEPRAQLKLRLAGFLAWGSSDLTRAAAVCRDAGALFEDAGDQRGSLLAAQELAFIEGLGGSLRAMQAGAERVVAAARARGDRVVLWRALFTWGVAAIMRGEFDVARAANDEALALARAEGDRYREATALEWRAVLVTYRGRVNDARAALEQSIRAADRPALGPRITVWWLTGDYCRALSAARQNWPGADRFGRREFSGLTGAAIAAAEHGDLAEARRYCTAAAEVARGWEPFSDGVAAASAVCAWREGRAAEALPALREAIARMIDADAIALFAPVATDWAELAARSGCPDPAPAAGLGRIAERTGLPGYRGLADLAAAWTAWGDGRPAPAVAAAARAAKALSRCGWSAHSARADVVAGMAEPDRDRAVGLLRSAAETFAACGALVRREETLDALARLGSQGKRAAAAAAGPESLTAREREIAGLAATGRSAKEIAAELFLAERTVEGHLGRAYGRLGVRSKTELAHRAAEFGLGPE